MNLKGIVGPTLMRTILWIIFIILASLAVFYVVNWLSG